ncbi:chemotaxis protein CheW [Paenibacillus agricola]|uniref:Chemotaxis protein CheW n=1 Tax=Paenibacillus agricola TaxID=2716264 RepID=A0ABX0J2X8_9BACL|nr:chemotaxis protein CheW [Paenibacillus agricola]NHN29755.1 chemotaxis protein CheW [Paenibacillus agricola]
MSILLRDQYMEMVLDKEYFAINTQDVHKIIKMQPIFDDYEVGSNSKGVIYLRDKAIPIISMRSLFGMKEVAYTQATRIIIHKQFTELAGFIVDQVNRTSTFDEIQPALDEVGSIKRDYVQGITYCESRLVRILNMGEIISQAQC